MAFQPDKIQVGPARIFVGVTNPTSGAPPTKIAHTAGVPASGTEIGLTEGDTVFEYTAEKNPITAEQYYAPVDCYLTQEMCKATFTAKESIVAALRSAFDNVGQVSTVTEDLFYGGQGSGAFACLKQSVFLSARQRVDPSKYIIVLIYKAYSSKNLAYTFSRTKEATYPVELTGLADTARTTGDAMFQFYIEK